MEKKHTLAALRQLREELATIDADRGPYPFDSGIIRSSALPRSRRCEHRRRLDPAVALALGGSRQLQRDFSFVRVAGFASAGSCSWNTRAWASSPCPRGCHSTQTLRSNLPLSGGNGNFRSRSVGSTMPLRTDGSIFLISFIRSIRGVNSACKAKSAGSRRAARRGETTSRPGTSRFHEGNTLLPRPVSPAHKDLIKRKQKIAILPYNRVTSDVGSDLHP